MIQSHKTLEFLQKLKDSGNWNDEYDYSEVDFINTKTKIDVIKKDFNTIHSIFPSQLIKGVKLFLRNAKDKTEFAKQNIKLNHDLDLNLDAFKYESDGHKFELVCPKHNIKWKTTYGNLIQNKSCKQCGIEKFSKSNTKTKEYWLEKFTQVHGDKFDYSKSVFKGTNDKILIICENKHEFFQSPSKHSSGTKCPYCAGNIKYTFDDILKKFKSRHGDKYGYDKVIFTSIHKKVKIFCKDHGYFEQEPVGHYNGSGCPGCAHNTTVTEKEWIKRFKSIHGDKYLYDKVKYKSIHEHIIIDCIQHGEFLQTPAAHYHQKQGCPTCGIGWNSERIINFITDIRNEDVLEMDPVELNMLITQGKLPKEFEELVFTLEGTKENSLKTLKEKLGIEDDEEISEERSNQLAEDLEKLNPEYAEEMNDAIDAMAKPEFDDLEEQEIEREKRRGLPNISNDDILVLDKELVNSCDDEAVEFFIKYKLRKVWNEVINEKRNPDDIKKLKGGKNSSRLRDLFNEEYKTVINYKPPEGYNFNKKGVVLPPNLMQKLTVNRIKEFKRYGNWSGTGAGKTLSFIIASREVDARLTVVICLNATVNQLKEEIIGVYPDSLVFDYMNSGQVFDRTKYNFLLLNYEKFQQGYSEEMFQDLNNNNLVDFIVIDEVHNAKQRSKEESLRRGVMMRFIGRSSEMNPNFHLLGMSATPVINNLIEAKSLLKLVTGKDYKDLGTRGTINNALKIFNQLLINGVRNIPKYDIVLNELTAKNTELLDIDGSDSLEELKSNGNKDYLGLEKILLESKLDVIDSFLKPKTIVYTYFTDNDRIPKRIAQYIKKKGYSYGLYIGEYDTEEREKSLTRFIKGDTDILIASRTIGTGVDGLQDVCNRMIILTLPWTDSEYTQLKGRIYRQGSEFGDVDIIIPQVHVQLDNNTNWSWDKQRLQLIRDKRTLADAAVDGIIPSKNLPTREKLCQDSLKALRDWKKRALEGKITMINREDLTLPLRPEIIEYLRPSLGDFSKMNQKWSVTRSEKTFKRLQTDPKEWFYYHQMYAEKRKDWDEIPYEVIAKKIDKRPDWIVADMGCGENLLSKEIKNKVHAFDFYSNDDDVVQCDMKNVPLDSDSVDVVVFCLALMAPNYLEHLKEGCRILRTYSKMFICQPYKKMEGKIDKFKSEIEELGFSVDYKTSSQKFVYFDCTKN